MPYYKTPGMSTDYVRIPLIVFLKALKSIKFLKSWPRIPLSDVKVLSLMIMMIAFITINSGLVPLIEGLCAEVLYFRFEIISGLRLHLLLLFFGRKF